MKVLRGLRVVEGSKMVLCLNLPGKHLQDLVWIGYFPLSAREKHYCTLLLGLLLLQFLHLYH